ncbi:Crp/Fnr family transcriptional regulator [Photobacterium proteolyticum]|uniref:Crp/Fnr family transcriptional regulator n=1 Tax=Photobacterium proteolyticum TaxID=1903952 RepID=A0A1Q9GF60_9GAMM|nr:Crp/Fnr family transcriptional regulator [Photobacterium proteolyticum]OLQ72939.1 Crp/Fnr family transcriptional regulator [Photobacterium proteolyticum]
MQLKPYQTGRFTQHLNTLYQEFRQAFYQCQLHSRYYQAGEEILRQGQVVDHLYLTSVGRVSMNISAVNGRRFQLGEVDCDYHVFGEMELFTDTSCQWSVVAEEQLEVDVICLKSVADLLLERPEFTLFFASALANDYQDSLDIYTYRLLHPITYNIAYDLWHRHQESVMLGAFDKAGQEAERFGTSSRVYRRAVKELIDKGLVVKDGAEIQVVDLDALKAFIDQFE